MDAICHLDTCGALPFQDTAKVGSAAWPRHAFSGPWGWGGFDQADDAPEEQWTFHAIASVIKAHSYLRALPEVDETRIGVTGISWGGYLTCIAAGVDPRFRCAAPVYGCGYLTEDSTWVQSGAFDKLSEEQRDFWTENWPDNIWHEISVEIDRESGTLSRDLPPDTRAATFSLFDHDFNQINSDVIFPFQIPTS